MFIIGMTMIGILIIWILSSFIALVSVVGNEVTGDDRHTIYNHDISINATETVVICIPTKAYQQATITFSNNSDTRDVTLRTLGSIIGKTSPDEWLAGNPKNTDWGPLKDINDVSAWTIVATTQEATIINLDTLLPWICITIDATGTDTDVVNVGLELKKINI